jgi:hypothetical protein
MNDAMKKGINIILSAFKIGMTYKEVIADLPHDDDAKMVYIPSANVRMHYDFIKEIELNPEAFAGL